MNESFRIEISTFFAEKMVMYPCKDENVCINWRKFRALILRKERVLANNEDTRANLFQDPPAEKPDPGSGDQSVQRNRIDRHHSADVSDRFPAGGYAEDHL